VEGPGSFLCFFEFLGGVYEARTSQTLISYTKYDVSPKGIKDSSLKRKKEWQKWTHGRAAGSETGFPAGEGKEREKWKGFWIN